MPHIQLNESLPGIRALLAFSPHTAAPLGALANTLLRSDNGLTPAERELIGAYVSSLNDCFYCQHSHAAIASCYLSNNTELVNQVISNYHTAPVSGKLKALLCIAGKVQQSGRNVLPADIDNARAAGATEHDIHDTVLIAALFCLFNRYVDGLATVAPTDMNSYRQRAKQVAAMGYGSHVYTSQQP
ncbi:carboxymuconolactone decarboxylase family protein [Deminuibacter soli]|nr:peroxidase-related enzyme [Deminuibacter soli]